MTAVPDVTAVTAVPRTTGRVGLCQRPTSTTRLLELAGARAGEPLTARSQ